MNRLVVGEDTIQIPCSDSYSAPHEECQILVFSHLDQSLHKSSTILCMAMINVPYESSLLALQKGTAHVKSFCTSLPSYDFTKKTTIKNILGIKLPQS